VQHQLERNGAKSIEHAMRDGGDDLVTNRGGYRPQAHNVERADQLSMTVIGAASASSVLTLSRKRPSRATSYCLLSERAAAV
jgi:hypothetical protein